MPAKPANEQQKKSIHVICKIIGQIPCFIFTKEDVAHRFPTSKSEISFRAMTHNAALDSTLMNLRCFNEFFTSERQQDDICASDFPGVSMRMFLAPDDAKAIKKYLAHITATRADIVSKHWFGRHGPARFDSTALNFYLRSRPPFRLRLKSCSRRIVWCSRHCASSHSKDSKINA